MLPVRGHSWPALADARGKSKTLHFFDPNQAEPMYQQMVGLHQPLTGDQSRMVLDRGVKQEATRQWKESTVNVNAIRAHQRINIVFAHFDTASHSDREILALTETELGLTYDDPPM